MNLGDLEHYVEQIEEGQTISTTPALTHLGKLVEIAWEAHSLADETISEAITPREAADRSEKILALVEELEAI